jgi:hypothetical protein
MLEEKIRVQAVIRIGMSVQNVTTLATLLKPNMLNIDQIKKLKEKASASPWSNLHNGDHEADKDFLMHSHKIADTAIKALERVEELEEKAER